MPKGKWRLEITEDFAASHQLRHYEGKCERMHGHNFGVKAVVQGDRLEDKTEMLIDFKVLRKSLKAVLAHLDHRHLNEVEPFDTCNPSSENIARFIYQGLAKELGDTGVEVHSVTVSENIRQSATYFEE